MFEDENGKRWMKNVMEKRYDLLCVSQVSHPVLEELLVTADCHSDSED